MKKFASVLLAAALTLSLAACGAKTNEGAQSTPESTTNTTETTKIPVIGINQYGEHPSLDNCREGFIQGLESAGLTEGVDFIIDYQNAGFDDNINTQIGQNFSANNVSLMCGIATPSAMSCYAAAENKDIPVVYVAVTDPEAAGLTAGGITGVSDKLAVDGQLALIRAMQPEATTIGIIYTLSEPNSVSAIAEYEEKAADYGFTIAAYGVTAQSEVTLAATALISQGVDCFSNLTDNNVVGVLASILEKTNEAGIPVYGSEIEQVKIGCVASIGIDYVVLGAQAGVMAAAIIKGEKTADDISYETISQYSMYINSEALEELGMSVDDEIISIYDAIDTSK